MDRTNLHYDSSQKTVGKCGERVWGPLFGFKMRDSNGSKREKADPLFIILETQLSKTCKCKCKAGAKHAGQAACFPLFFPL